MPLFWLTTQQKHVLQMDVDERSDTIQYLSCHNCISFTG